MLGVEFALFARRAADPPGYFMSPPNMTMTSYSIYSDPESITPRYSYDMIQVMRYDPDHGCIVTNEHPQHSQTKMIDLSRFIALSIIYTHKVV